MSESGLTFSRIAKINVKFAYAAFLGWLAYVCWPSRPEYWGFGWISICAGLSGAILAITAIIDLTIAIVHDYKVGKYSRAGRASKDDKLAGKDTQRGAGLIK